MSLTQICQANFIVSPDVSDPCASAGELRKMKAMCSGFSIGTLILLVNACMDKVVILIA